MANEDLGKIFEKALCDYYEIEYNGKFKYNMNYVNKLITLFNKVNLKKNITLIEHTAQNQNPKDFKCLDFDLSAKTNKTGFKVSPQIIGQPTKKTFCDYFKCKSDDTTNIKQYIIDNINQMLPEYEKHTFMSHVLYYQKKKNMLLYIRSIKPIDWTNKVDFSHIKKNKVWNESTTIYINNISIGEFQVHNHRNCIKFRWSFDKILKMFKDNFDILELKSP